jgi:YcxB-like protein
MGLPTFNYHCGRLTQQQRVYPSSFDPMSVTFTVEPKDMRAFSAHNRKYNPANKRLRYAVLVIFCILSYQHAVAHYKNPARAVIEFCVYLAIYLTIIWSLRIILERVRQWRSLTPKEQPGLFCEHTITLTDDALIEITPVNEARHLWAGLHSVVNAPHYVFIFVAANAAHIIPKRAFANPEAADVFFYRAFKLWSDAKRPALKT